MLIIILLYLHQKQVTPNWGMGDITLQHLTLIKMKIHDGSF